jgi:hypothetical protein
VDIRAVYEEINGKYPRVVPTLIVDGYVQGIKILVDCDVGVPMTGAGGGSIIYR